MADELKTWKDLETAVILKAWRDDAFRQELLSNPKAALAKLLGRPLPDDLQVLIHEETPKTIHLVVPEKPATTWNVNELSEGQLGGIAAGAGPLPRSIKLAQATGINTEMEY